MPFAESDALPSPPAVTAPPRVLARVRERIAAQSLPGQRADSWHLALVVQGGAMRGVFTAGALCGLEALGARPAFDSIHASSGGAVNSAYFLAGQVELGTSIYYEDVNNRQFIDFRRLVAGTALGLDYCFGEVVAKRKRLDLGAVRRSKTELEIHVTDAETAEPRYFRQHELCSDSELLSVLKASAAMPLVYRKPIWIRDRRTVDGALFKPLPVQAAIDRGATDVLVLMSRPLAVAERPPQAWAMPFGLKSVGARSRAAVAASWRECQAELRETLALLRKAGDECSALALA
ncbi:MAG TPA: patatin-like phospholipase family protein, partial [Candidatus Udaeobacter sp.]|nr:patatin-like phospholipase family protein [Candidatus Udaeobacter sp.]